MGLAAQGKRRTNFIRAGPSTSLRFAQDDNLKSGVVMKKSPARGRAFLLLRRRRVSLDA
jgi:hypothetical protein